VLNNDISTLKSVVKGSVYFKTNGSGGGLYIAGSSSDSGETTTGISNKLSNVRAYMPEIFYIRRFSATDGDGIPTLVRETLVGTVMQEQPMVDGIQDMQIEWGVDGTDAGNEPDYYVANPTAQELGDAVTARVYLLVRSVQPVTGYKNDKTYNLGSTVTGPFNDAYYRRVYTATVSMRNAPKIKFLII
jgi:type IV pilus assembly protein PilW